MEPFYIPPTLIFLAPKSPKISVFKAKQETNFLPFTTTSKNPNFKLALNTVFKAKQETNSYPSTPIVRTPMQKEVLQKRFKIPKRAEMA